jgi:hypothetical protein
MLGSLLIAAVPPIEAPPMLAYGRKRETPHEQHVGSWFLFTARTPSPSACLFCRLAISGGVLFPLPLGHVMRVGSNPGCRGVMGRAAAAGHRQAAIALLSGRQSAARQLPLPAPAAGAASTPRESCISLTHLLAGARVTRLELRKNNNVQ